MHLNLIQNRVKLPNKTYYKTYLIRFILISFLLTSCAKKQFPTLQEIRSSLGGGTNVSHFEQTWKKTSEIFSTDITPKLQQIAQQGFRTVRLPIAFDMYTYPNSSTLQPELLTKLKEIYYICYNLNLKLILTFHYGMMNEHSMYNHDINHVSWIWKQIQAEFKGHGYDYLFFELYNEPTMEAKRWKQTIEKLISYIRHEDDLRIYIVGGSNYNGLNDLIEMGKLKDNRLFYTFHYYEPFIFTHQGAEWTIEKSYMKGFPYPYKRNKMPDFDERAKGTSVEKDYKKYYYEGTYEYINGRINQIANFCYKNDMPLVCTEFGVIDVADEDSRKQYLKDITKSLNQYNIKGMVWDYDQRFIIVNKEGQVLSPIKKWAKKAKKGSRY